MINIDTKQRSKQEEIMDDFSLEGEELRYALDKIADINRLLGGNKVTLNGVKRLLHKNFQNESITIADVGCGNGDMLRMLAEYGLKNGISFNLIGIDANLFTINYAIELSANFPNISYLCMDIFEDEFKSLKYDIVISTLTLHHFKDEEIIKMMELFYDNSSIGVVINDLHRSKISYRLFSLICSVFNLNRMSREDGLISILRGFKKNELVSFSKRLGFKKYNIAWQWAFRYEWIITKA